MKTTVLLLVISALCIRAQESATLTVSADANIFGAGHANPPAPAGGGSGSLPPSYSLPPTENRVLTFTDVSGSCSMTVGGGVFGGPDGYYNMASTDIASCGGVSGIRHPGAGFLAGIFLGPTEPTDPAPNILDFNEAGLGTNFPSISPAIGQVFFIGDGLTGTGTGTAQQFLVPASATRLFLGLVDGFGYTGLPGQYQDNSGSFTATFTITPSAPRLSIEVSQVRLCWNSETNKSYQIQYRSESTTNQWADLGAPITGNGATVCTTNDVATPPRFYRVVGVP
jgi:hypothetical protein